MIKSALRLDARRAGSASRSLILLAMLGSATAIAQSETTLKDRHITVESGDTFSGILSRELQSLDAWGDVARYNKLASPDNLKPGDVIIIPKEVLRLRNYATVVYMKGTALRRNSAGGAQEALKKGDKIFIGDIIETDADGFVSVSFNGGSSVNIQPESTMKINLLECIDRKTACEIKLRSEKGQLGLDVKSVGFEKPTEFSIDSPFASAAVRGTRFDFDIDDGNILGVTEGTVEISLNGITNDVNIGKGVLAGQGRSINDLYDLLVKPEFKLRDDINRVSSEDIINWGAVPEAGTYLLAYAPSESMQDVLVSQTMTNTFTKPELPAGTYYVSARAIATNGLRGFSNKKQIQSVSIDESVVGPELDVLIDGTQMQVTPSGSASDSFEVKIGNALESIESKEYIVSDSTHQVKGGETITVEIDLGKQWYLQGRKVVSQSAVSPYGLLYFLEKSGN